MATVMRLMLDDPDPRFDIRVVPTFVDASPATRLRVGLTGMIRATLLVLFRRVDLVHIHLSHGGSVARKSLPLLAARMSGVPAIVHGHSFDFAGWMARIPKPAASLVRVALPADRWLVLGNTLADEYRECLRVSPDVVRVLYNPVRLVAARATPEATSRVVEVVSFGRLGHRKGSYDLVRAIELLPPEVRATMHVSLAGDGEVEEVRAAVASGSLNSTITVLGWVDSVTRDQLLGEASVFVLPSYDEGLPMAILEAMANGVVPVTTPVGGIPEAVSDRVSGLLVPPGDPDALAAAISEITSDSDLRRRLAAGARTRAADFDIDVWYAALATEWTELVVRRRDRARVPKLLRRRRPRNSVDSAPAQQHPDDSLPADRPAGRTPG